MSNDECPTPRTDKARLDEHDPHEAVAAECGKLERELAAAKARIYQMEDEAAFNAWKVSPAMAQAKIDQLNERIRRLEQALEFGVGRSRAMELMAENHIGEVADMVEETKEVPCPDCYGGHFKPCNICGDSGVALLKTQAKEAKP